MGFSHDHLRQMFLKTAGLLGEIQRLRDCDPKLHEFTATVVGDLSQRSAKRTGETWCKHGPRYGQRDSNSPADDTASVHLHSWTVLTTYFFHKDNLTVTVDMQLLHLIMSTVG